MKRLKIAEIPELSYSSREAMNRLRVNLSYCGDKYRAILVTSSVPNEGKSSIAFHLWKMMANAGKRVLLIDADIRKSTLRSRYRMIPEEHNAPGLVNFLAGQVSLNDVIYETEIPGAWIIPTFRTVSNPSLLLTDARFEDMMNLLKNEEDFDYIFVDTAPVASVADALEIAGVCDGALVVVHGGVTPKKIIRESIKQLASVNCPIIGTVLNQVKVSENAYYHKYYKYGCYYGKNK